MKTTYRVVLTDPDEGKPWYRQLVWRLWAFNAAVIGLIIVLRIMIPG